MSHEIAYSRITGEIGFAESASTLPRGAYTLAKAPGQELRTRVLTFAAFALSASGEHIPMVPGIGPNTTYRAAQARIVAFTMRLALEIQ